MEKLLPDVLSALWRTVDEKRFTGKQFYYEQQRLLDGYRQTWTAALLLEDHQNLKESLLWELGSYLGRGNLTEVERRCSESKVTAKREWEKGVQPGDRRAVEQYYEDSEGTLYELMWWHTLCSDASPLAYVTALHFGRRHGCRDYLDFGAGVGSGGILFARHGFGVSLADISSSLLSFCSWRFDLRRLPAQFFDLKSRPVPLEAFDFITAMDVFEHLFDPVETAEALWQALKPKGFLFGRFGAQEDENAPQHIVRDFGPTFKRMQELGFVQVWRDEWLWGHQVFQKS
jgi:SAM-dependent methyltransferase